MGSPVKSTLLGLSLAALLSAATFNYHVAGDDPGSWPQILSAIGLTKATGGPANLLIVRTLTAGSTPQWIQRIEQGAVVAIEGENELTAALGIHAGKKRVVVRSIVDQHASQLPIIWEHALELPVFELPSDARIFAAERWSGAPLLAAIRRGAGAALWIAVSPGTHGYERFPYLLQALGDLGVKPPFRSQRLWAFFDGSYRSRVDLEYFAERWRKAGISVLHVAGWHYWEPEKERDEYVRRLIEACHRRALLVYVWLELPHVSQKFWADHPQWREKTALQQDAQLDWRKLMNLSNRECSAEVWRGLQGLLERFDWDGVNLAELYFESLEGAANPARFTPMNDDVRADFRRLHRFDPLELFRAGTADSRLRLFLDYRAELASRQQEEWVDRIETIRVNKPNLDFVLTQVDDRFDTRMRELIGADSTRALPLLDQHDFTFLIEDPATIWNLGPQRYQQIASRYQPLTDKTNKLAIDINIVERYQDVYPTRQQTGTELFQLVHLAAKAFPQVALYFENSILAPDLPLLSSAAANVDKAGQQGPKLTVDARYAVGIPWEGPALVNGKLWPVRDDTTVWLPAGSNVIEPGLRDPPIRILDFNGNLHSAAVSAHGLQISYQSSSRAVAILTLRPAKIEIDNVPAVDPFLDSAPRTVVMLPRGQHIVDLTVAGDPVSRLAGH